jgi:hypothetical protein
MLRLAKRVNYLKLKVLDLLKTIKIVVDPRLAAFGNL